LCALPAKPTIIELLNDFKSTFENITHSRPWNLSNIEELVVSSYNNPVFPRLVLDLRGEQTSCKSRKRRRNVIIFELVHLPALNLDTGVILYAYVDERTSLGDFMDNA
jgi:hypothetical protein